MSAITAPGATERASRQALHLSPVESWACAVLRGELEARSAPDEESCEAALARLRYHGVTALLHQRLGAGTTCAAAMARALRDDALGHTMWELRHQKLIGELLACLASKDIRPILFKGTALAYSAYDAPATRIRGDTDLLIAEPDRAEVDRTLAEMAFRVDCGEDMSYVRFQACYVWEGAEPNAHAVDLHWGISNSYLLSRLFSYQELRASAVPLPALAPSATAANAVYAILIACMHRARHKQSAYTVDGVAHYGGDRLIWLYDIHLLASALSPTEWDEVVRLSREKTLGPICREGLQRAQLCFATALPSGILDQLEAGVGPQTVADYLEASRLRQHWLDLRAVPGARNRLRFAAELLLPPADYMRSISPDARGEPLAWLYARRVVRRMTRRRSPGGSAA